MSTQRQGTSEVDMQIGQAWSLHYKKDHDAAIKSFREIVGRWPENVDANYGLALSLRGADQKEESAKYFHKAKELTEAALTDQSSARSSALAAGSTTSTGEDPRMMLVGRMIDQQLALLQR